MSSAFDAGLERHRAGDLAEAERLYRATLTEHPDHLDALFFLGLLAMNSGRLDLAVELFGRGVTLAPRHAPMIANLGEVYRKRRDVNLATLTLLKAMFIKPDLVEPPYNLGLHLQDCGEFEGAIACFERAAELRPDLLPDVRKRVAAVRRQGKSRSSLSADGLVALATTLTLHGRRETAIALLRRALKLEPNSAGAHGAIGKVMKDLERLDEAIVSLERAVALDPEKADLHVRLGDAQLSSGLAGAAIASFRRAAALRAKGAEAAPPAPGSAIAAGDLLFAVHFHPDYDARAILEDAREWDRVHARPLAAQIAPHGNDRTPGRRLRIGYVSPDFRDHAASFFLVPLFARHDHERFEVFAYSNVHLPDHVTLALRGHTDQWRDVTVMNDAEAAACIRADRIDVLVDLAMHMGRNRLGIFARKPAPIQVCWLAYPGTTGLSTMDYRVTDPFLDPPESDTSVYSERSLWLPDTFWCYDPLVRGDSVTPLPAQTAGHVSFGCLNNFCKVNDAVLELWARVMREVDGSTFVLLAPPGAARRRALDLFEKFGVSRKRIDFVGRAPRLPYLATYAKIDVCLDTFPYNGHTTSLDALWMGVPVVTLVGPTVVGRAGLCQAQNVGLPELVARTPDQYVSIAVDLCKDLGRLADLRAGLRARMERSPLMDAPRFARNLEAAYRRIWQTWCDVEEHREAPR